LRHVERFASRPEALDTPKRTEREARSGGRRETDNRVAPEIIRRPSSSSDGRLRILFNGERGLPFTKTENL